MINSPRISQTLKEVAGAVALVGASCVLFVLLRSLTGRFGGYRWDAAGYADVPGVIPRESYPWATWAAFLVATVALPLAWERTAARASFSEIGFSRGRGVLKWTALAVLLTALLFAYLALALRVWHKALPAVLTSGNALYFVLIWAVTASGEETLYRGIFQRRLTHAVGLLPGIVVASAVWAFAGHVRAPALENLVFRLPAGLLLGCLYARPNSLYPPMLAHWLLNMAVVSGLWTANGG